MSDTETKTVHTPGPWRLSKHQRFDVYADTPPAGLRFIGTTYGNGDMPPHIAREDEANARLIAAAPDLLEACRLAIADGFELTDKTVDALHNAFAKAIGRHSAPMP